ncbi:hypothetical protein LTR85_005125 [Meristemomyces frigidus]|nr:hypothetical protein LTR85_005125 [Meristemomyces frigidus]
MCSINKPWLFRTSSIKDMKLVWKLFKHSTKDRKALVGAGVAMMATLNSGIRPNKESLVRETTIALQCPVSMSTVGSVTFSFFWASPLVTPPHLAKPHSWSFGNGIGGHRGSGKNKIDHRQLQLGENTPQSFLTAIDHGASFIELGISNVQLTKDLVPVVYHDFLLSETGTDTPMHDLSFEQFDYINQAQGPRWGRGKRSNSVGATDTSHLDALAERMAHTYFNRANGFKANTRGSFIHEQSCSLEDIFRAIGPTVPLNIELKYPMLFETDEWDMELIAIKTDIFVDTVLNKVYEHAQGRTIVFSSFSPEICIALSTKQRSYPVFFLSKTSAPRGDLRACCIQQAIHFAKSWGLPGIVTECTPFIRCPRLIGYVRSAGLACSTFGVLNSDPACAKIQFDGGMNAVISDSVGALMPIKRIGGSDVQVFP